MSVARGYDSQQAVTVRVETLEVQKLWGRGVLRALWVWATHPLPTQALFWRPTYQLGQHLLQLLHIHMVQVLCLGLPDTADGRFCRDARGSKVEKAGGA